jgi:hypothetical protein
VPLSRRHRHREGIRVFLDPPHTERIEIAWKPPKAELLFAFLVEAHDFQLTESREPCNAFTLRATPRKHPTA